MEKNYDFRKRLWSVHKADRRDMSRKRLEKETELDGGWKIGFCGGEVTKNAALDFQEYMWTSMGVSMKMTDHVEDKTLWIQVDAKVQRGIRFHIDENSVLITLAKDEDAFRAVVHLEDMMNLESATVLPRGDFTRTFLYDGISVHSGSGLDYFPDEELRAMVHAGYDTAVLFVKGFDETTAGYCDINDVIERAERFGVRILLYSYLTVFVHPDSPEAEKAFDEVYGELFRR